MVRPEPFGKASEGRQGARGGARQPGIELGRLALADEGGEVLRERHRLRQLGRLLGQLRQLVVILRRRPLRRAEDQPGGPTRGERASWRLRHRGQRLSAAPLPGGQPLGLAHASDIQRHNPILAPKALAADRPEEMRSHSDTRCSTRPGGSALYGSRRLRSRPCRGWRSGNVGLWR